jgi:uncharacterized protein involved in oxidation of intracellular sulfur
VEHHVCESGRRSTQQETGEQLKTLVILNDPPYGSERSYNGLRLAGALAKRDGAEIRVFLMGDAASCGKAGQQVPQGFYNVERMLRVITQARGAVGVCGSCMDARGIGAAELSADARRSTLEELADWSEWADRVLVF